MPPRHPTIYFLTCTLPLHFLFFFFFNDTATTEIYTLSLHDPLPISRSSTWTESPSSSPLSSSGVPEATTLDRKSTRLNSSHSQNLVCRLLLEKKKKKQKAVLR